MKWLLPFTLLLFLTACTGTGSLKTSKKSLELARGFQVHTVQPHQALFLRWQYNDVLQEPVRYTNESRGSALPTTVNLAGLKDDAVIVTTPYWYNDSSTPFGTAPAYQVSENDYALVIPLRSIREIYLPTNGRVPAVKEGDREAYKGNLARDILIGALGGALIAAGGRAANDISRNEAVYSRTPPTGLIFIGAAIGALAYPIYNLAKRPHKTEYNENVERLENMQKYVIGPEGWKLRVVSK